MSALAAPLAKLWSILAEPISLDETEESYVRHRQTILLIKQVPVSAGSNIVLSALTVLVFWTVAPTALTLSFGGLIWCLAGLQIWQWRRKRRAGRSLNTIKGVGVPRKSIVLALVTGAIWGVFSFVAFPFGTAEERLILTLVAAGMSAGTVATMFAVPMACYAFTFAFITPMFIRFAGQGDFISSTMAAIFVVYAQFIVFAARNGYRSFIEGVRKGLENERLVSELSETQRRLIDAIENIPSGFLYYGSDGRIALINTRAAEYWPGLEHLLKPGTHFSELVEAARPYIRFDRPVDVDFDHYSESEWSKSETTYDLQLHDGRWLRIAHRRTSNGGIVRTQTDISEQKAAERAIIAAKEQAERMAQEKADFLANMSHEIRTPLNGVLGLSRLLQQTGLDQEQQSYVAKILNSGEILLRVINDILDLSKLESGAVELKFADFNVGETVATTVSLFTESAADKGIALGYSVAPDVPAVVCGDATRLQQVLVNLIGNAIKFTDEGHVHVSVSHRQLSDADHALEFEVVDTGIGLDNTDADRLFERFTQADGSTTRRFGGTGLGLAICKQLTEAMGGTIGVESVPGQGSQFRFSILCTPGLDRTSTPQQGGAEKTRWGRPLSLLVAEDNQTNQLYIQKLLENAGYDVVVVSTGKEAVARVRQSEFDAVLMDVQMPEMDGPMATAEIRALNGTAAAVPILALTANALDSSRQDYLAAGMNDYVSKPIDPEELFAAIGRVTDNEAAAVLPQSAAKPAGGAEAQAMTSEGEAALQAILNRIRELEDGGEAPASAA